ncbi:MAG: DUF3347 domain-containing protein, partial [Pedobacter sp.]
MKNNIKTLPAVILAATFFFYSCESKNTEGTSETKAEETVQTEVAKESLEPWMEQEAYTNVPVPVQQAVSGMLTNYLTLKDLLLEANTEKVATAAREMGVALVNVPGSDLPAEQQQFYKEHTQGIQKQAELISGSTNIEDQRAKLDELTKHVYALT